MNDIHQEDANAQNNEPVESQTTQVEVDIDDNTNQETQQETAVEETRSEQEETGQEESATESVDVDVEVDIEATNDTIPKARFNEIYYQNKQREREIEQLKAQMASQSQQPVEAPEVAAPPPVNKPTLEQYDYDEAVFQEALVDWKLDQRDIVAKQAVAQKEVQTKVDTFRDAQVAYAEKNKNYEDLTNQAVSAGIVFNDSVAEVIMESEVGVKVHHHLLANPSKIDELNRMTPMKQMRELISIENKFTQKKATPAKKAAAVINPVTGTSSAAGAKSLDQAGKMSPADYYKMRMKELNGK